MALIADILLVAGALSAGLYCLVLSRRLTKFTDLEKGVGGAVAVLSAQVDDMTKALATAQSAAGVSAESLQEMTARGEEVAKRLEIMLAAMHDLPDEAPEPAKSRKVVWRRPRDKAPEEAPQVAFTRSATRLATAEASE